MGDAGVGEEVKGGEAKAYDRGNFWVADGDRLSTLGKMSIMLGLIPPLYRALLKAEQWGDQAHLPVRISLIMTEDFAT